MPRSARSAVPEGHRSPVQEAAEAGWRRMPFIDLVYARLCACFMPFESEGFMESVRISDLSASLRDEPPSFARFPVNPPDFDFLYPAIDRSPVLRYYKVKRDDAGVNMSSSLLRVSPVSGSRSGSSGQGRVSAFSRACGHACFARSLLGTSFVNLRP